MRLVLGSAPPGELLRVSAVARRLGCSVWTVRRLLEAGRLEGQRTGVGVHWRVPAEAVEVYLASLRPARR